MNKVSEKRALITGTSQGLGKALADQLLADGWHVVGIDVLQEKSVPHPALECLQCDLSDRQSVDTLIGQLDGQGFDLVIFNAAVSASGSFKKIPLEVHLELLRLNAETPMIMTARLAATGMLNPDARLAFVSSLSHFTGYPGAASYAASKDAMAIYAKSIRKPFAKIGIKVSCIFPGPMRTGQADRHAPRGSDADKRMLPETAARTILAGLARGKAKIIPGGGTKAFAWAGRLAPFFTDRAMRKIIHDKLDKEVF